MLLVDSLSSSSSSSAKLGTGQAAAPARAALQAARWLATEVSKCLKLHLSPCWTASSSSSPVACSSLAVPGCQISYLSVRRLLEKHGACAGSAYLNAFEESSRRHVSSSQATNAPGSTSFLILDHLESIQEWQCLDLEEAEAACALHGALSASLISLQRSKHLPQHRQYVLGIVAGTDGEQLVGSCFPGGRVMVDKDLEEVLAAAAEAAEANPPKEAALASSHQHSHHHREEGEGGDGSQTLQKSTPASDPITAASVPGPSHPPSAPQRTTPSSHQFPPPATPPPPAGVHGGVSEKPIASSSGNPTSTSTAADFALDLACWGDDSEVGTPDFFPQAHAVRRTTEMVASAPSPCHLAPSATVVASSETGGGILPPLSPPRGCPPSDGAGEMPTKMKRRAPKAAACSAERESLLLTDLMEREAAMGCDDVEEIVRQTEGFEAAEIKHLCHLAQRHCSAQRSPAVDMMHFEAALLEMTA